MGFRVIRDGSLSLVTVFITAYRICF